MIHQWQYDVLGQRPDHGPEFLDKVAVMARDGLHVTVYHTFEEQVSAFLTYAWRCVACGQEYHRQRRTIRPRDHRCGTCYGPLGEVLPGKFPRKRRRIRPQRRSIQQQPAAVLQLDLPFPSF
jgi:predicted SprT family Zn-dependent metalloprotease